VAPRPISLPSPTGEPRRPPVGAHQPASTLPEPEPAGSNPYADQLRELRLMASPVYIEPAAPPEAEQPAVDLSSLVCRGALPAPSALPSVIEAKLAEVELLLEPEDLELDDEGEEPAVGQAWSAPRHPRHPRPPQPRYRLPRPWWLGGRALAVAGGLAAGLVVAIVLGLAWPDPQPEPAGRGVATRAQQPQQQEQTAPDQDTRVGTPTPFVIRLSAKHKRRRHRRARRRGRRRASRVDVDKLLTAGTRRDRSRRARRQTMLAAQVDVDDLLTAGRRSHRQARRVKLPDWAR
jgi:hypothetical protein